MNLTQQQALSTAAVTTLSTTDVAGLTMLTMVNGKSQLALSFAQLGALGANASGLTAAQIKALANLGPDYIQLLSPTAIASLSPAAFAALSAAQMGLVGRIQAAAFTDTQIRALSSDQLSLFRQIAAWSAHQLSLLSQSQIQNLALVTLADLGARITDFSSTQISFLSNTQLQTVCLTALGANAAGLTAGQMSVITDRGISALSITALKSLSMDAICAIAPKYLVGLNSATSAALVRIIDVTQLSATQIGNLNADKVASLTTDKTNGIGALSSAQLSALLKSTTLNPVLGNINGINGGGPGWTLAQFWAISASAITGLGTTDIALLNPTSLYNFSTAQIEALTQPQVAALLSVPALKRIMNGIGGTGTQWSVNQYLALSSAGQAAVTAYATAYKLVTISFATGNPANPNVIIPIAFLDPLAIANLSTTQIGLLTSTQLIGLLQASPSLAKVITGLNGGSAWTATQWQAVSTSTITNLGAQITGLSATNIAWLSAAQIGALTGDQLGAILQVSASTSPLLANVITKLSDAGGSVGAWTNAQFQAISAAAITSLGSCITLLSATDLLALSPTQMGALTGGQLSALLKSTTLNPVLGNINGINGGGPGWTLAQF